MAAPPTKPISTRVTLDLVDLIDSLKPLFPSPGSSKVTRSVLLRGLLIDFSSLLDPDLLSAVDALRDGRPRSVVVREIFDRGLAATKKDNAQPTRGKGKK